MAYIYKITNKQTGKVYIGKTLDTIEERWKEHLHDYKKRRCEKRPLYNSMNFYGPEVFTIEQVEECQPNELNEREIYWIAQYDSYYNGYNGTKGGDGKAYLDYDLIYKLFQEGKSIKEISQILQCDSGQVSKILTNFGVSAQEKQERKKDKLKKSSVAMLNKDTEEVIQIFSCVSDVQKFLNKERSRQHIAEVCQGKRKTAYGYKWKYIDKN